MMKSLLISVSLVIATAAPASAALLDQAVASLTNREATFTHTFTPKGFKRSTVERGSVVFGRVPQMRWSYRSPDAKTFVFDGSTSWFYVPAEQQVTINRLSDQDRAALPFLFLSDSNRLRSSYTISEGRSGGSPIVRLKGRTASVTVPDITLTLNRDNTIRRLEYSDRQGNRTAFDFGPMKKASPDAAAFRFVPPAGVQVVGN